MKSSKISQKMRVMRKQCIDFKSFACQLYLLFPKDFLQSPSVCVLRAGTLSTILSRPLHRKTVTQACPIHGVQVPWRAVSQESSFLTLPVNCSQLLARDDRGDNWRMVSSCTDVASTQGTSDWRKPSATTEWMCVRVCVCVCDHTQHSNTPGASDRQQGPQHCRSKPNWQQTT